jgi:hypothetical protein
MRTRRTPVTTLGTAAIGAVVAVPAAAFSFETLPSITPTRWSTCAR